MVEVNVVFKCDYSSSTYKFEQQFFLSKLIYIFVELSSFKHIFSLKHWLNRSLNYVIHKLTVIFRPMLHTDHISIRIESKKVLDRYKSRENYKSCYSLFIFYYLSSSSIIIILSLYSSFINLMKLYRNCLSCFLKAL